MLSNSTLIGGFVTTMSIIILVLFLLRMQERFDDPTHRLIRHGCRLTATVTAIRRGWEWPALSERVPFKPVFYVTATGRDFDTRQPLIFVTKFPQMPTFHEGDPVNVIVDPSNPTQTYSMFAGSSHG